LFAAAAQWLRRLRRCAGAGCGAGFEKNVWYA
jgi:hypothetical protein